MSLLGNRLRLRLVEAERAELADESEQRQQTEACCKQLAQALQGALALICDELQLSSMRLATFSARHGLTQEASKLAPTSLRHSPGAASTMPTTVMRLVLFCIEVVRHTLL